MSFPITWVVSRFEVEVPTDAVSRLEALVDEPTPVVADDDDLVLVDGVVVLLWSPVDAVSLLVVLVLGVVVLLVLLLGFVRSAPVCAIAAGAARAMARIAVGAIFIDILR